MIGEEHDFRPVISKLIVRHDRDKWWNNSKVVASFVKQASNQCMQVNDFTFIFCIITRCSRVDLGMTESWGWCPRILWFSISFKHRFDFCRWTCGYAILFQTTAVSEFCAITDCFQIEASLSSSCVTVILNVRNWYGSLRCGVAQAMEVSWDALEGIKPCKLWNVQSGEWFMWGIEDYPK